MIRRHRFPLALLALAAAACSGAPAAEQAANDPYQPQPYVHLTHPDWSKNATLYELNTRQFTPEGTFAAAAEQLPRLKDLGVDIVWLMPIHPIGEKNRKGTLGSPYSVRDYRAVNPEFGTLDDLKAFVAQAHQLGMHVILDWVANHTAWDNPLATEHPDWYAHDWKGDFRPTLWQDWADIIDLDYDSPGLRRYMTESMKYWVTEADVDGFRCDVAGYIPLDFWNEARKELDALKPVFMLAEAETRDLHQNAFDASYAWKWYDAVRQVSSGHADIGSLGGYYADDVSLYPADAMRMTFVSNHDKNSWDGTQFEQFGDGLEASIVLSVTTVGIPLLYNGQEAGNTKRLEFFEKDPIVWKDSPIGPLYKKLFSLKHDNTALWNAHWGAPIVPVDNSAPAKVLSFVRENDRDKVFVVLNYSDTPRSVTFDGPTPGSYVEYFSGDTVELTADSSVDVPAWGYKVFVRPSSGA